MPPRFLSTRTDSSSSRSNRVVVFRSVSISLSLLLSLADTNCQRPGPRLDVGAVVMLLVVEKSPNGFRALSVIAPSMVPDMFAWKRRSEYVADDGDLWIALNYTRYLYLGFQNWSTSRSIIVAL